jgi:hypothetical protein
VFLKAQLADKETKRQLLVNNMKVLMEDKKELMQCFNNIEEVLRSTGNEKEIHHAISNITTADSRKYAWLESMGEPSHHPLNMQYKAENELLKIQMEEVVQQNIQLKNLLDQQMIQQQENMITRRDSDNFVYSNTNDRLFKRSSTASEGTVLFMTATDQDDADKLIQWQLSFSKKAIAFDHWKKATMYHHAVEVSIVLLLWFIDRVEGLVSYTCTRIISSYISL